MDTHCVVFNWNAPEFYYVTRADRVKKSEIQVHTGTEISCRRFIRESAMRQKENTANEEPRGSGWL